MDRPLLLIGKETFIGSKIGERIAMEGKNVVFLTTEVPKNGSAILWNRLSYISTKTAIREMDRHYGSPEEVFIVFGRKRDELFPYITTSFVDDVIDSELKSLIYITQELYRKVLEQESQIAIYFVAENIYNAKNPVSSAVGAAFKAYAQAVMSNNNNNSIYMTGFELDGDDDDGFINYVLKNSVTHVAKKKNSWTLYPRGLKLFGIN